LFALERYLLLFASVLFYTHGVSAIGVVSERARRKMSVITHYAERKRAKMREREAAAQSLFSAKEERAPLAHGA